MLELPPDSEEDEVSSATHCVIPVLTPLCKLSGLMCVYMVCLCRGLLASLIYEAIQ